ncbi:MAG: hypothetical protein R6X02_17930 [Enhygromyxa sp.]
MRAGLALLLGLGCLLAASHARAGPPEASTRAPKITDDHSLADALIVEPGVTCLDRATLLAHLRSWRDSDRIDRRVSVRVRGSDSNPRVLGFMVEGGEAPIERLFSPAPEDCADLHAIVALAIAIALDDTLAGELGIVAPPPAVEQIQAGDGDLPRERRPKPTPKRKGPGLSVTAAGGLFAGLTPRLTGGGLVSFDIRPRDHFDLRIGALATHLPRFDLDSGRVAVTVAAGRFDLCWGTGPFAVRARMCGGLAGGATVSRGSGFSTNFQQTTPWFAGILGADLVAHLVGPLALELRLEGVFPFQRTRLDVRSEAGQLLATRRFPPVGLVLVAGPRFEF